MIITKEIDIIVNNNNRKYYTEKGYSIPKHKFPTIHIKIDDLPKRSNQKIECECDVCGKINILTYDKYNMNIERAGYYSCHGKCSRLKYKKTCNELFGYDNVFQNESIKEKCKETLMNKYNVINAMQMEETKMKSRESCLKKFGVEYSMQSLNNKIKTKMTLKNKYGVENIMHNLEIFTKSQINRKKSLSRKTYRDNLHYQGTYELDFLEKYYDVTIQNGPSIKFEFNGVPKIYYPDFYFKSKNLIVEIKSKYYYDLHLDLNLAKQKASIDQGYNYIFIIDKNYEEFDKLYVF